MTRWLRLLAALFAFGLLLAACGDDATSSGSSSGASDTPDYGGGGGAASCDTDVCMQDIAFSPDAVSVAVGDTVTWTDLDDTTHTVTADDGSFDSGDLSQGDTFEFTFDTAGDFTYHCSIHSSMTGTITVE